MENKQLIELIHTVSSSKLTEFQYEENGIKIGMKKECQVSIPQVKVEEIQINDEMEEETNEGKIITSALVGTFYTSPSEDAEPFVSIGDAVKQGQTLAIVEAMKLMNEIESEFDGVVEEIFVENGQAVEYGQPLFRLK
ncbi:acetyl-CoA carboxylase biotin carboxyl carrier protein [Faecalimonas sp.]